MANILGATSIDFGTSSMKNIDGDLVFQDDICIVVDSNSSYIYQLNESDTSTEVNPRIIQPSLHGTNKRWLLKTTTHWNSDLNFNKANTLQIHEFKSLDTDGFKFTLSDGTELGTIDANGLSINELFISGGNISVTSINDIDVTEFIKSDGSITFTDQIKGITPVSDDDLSNKGYVDTQISNLSSTLALSGLNNYIRFDNTVVYTPTTNYHPSTKKYVDDQIAIYDSNSDNIVDVAATITSQGALATLSEVTSGFIDSEIATLDQVLAADGSGGTKWNTIEVASGGGGSGLSPLIPNIFKLDDVNVGSERGSAFSMMETIDFSSTIDGSAWVSFIFPDTLDSDSDIDLTMFYHLNGTGATKNVRLKIDQWVTAIGVTPDSGTPTDSNIDDVAVIIGDDGEIRSKVLSVIANANITDNTIVTLKITRESSNVLDTYDGTFQMLYTIPTQA